MQKIIEAREQAYRAQQEFHTFNTRRTLLPRRFLDGTQTPEDSIVGVCELLNIVSPYDALTEAIAQNGSASYLDVGCGRGRALTGAKALLGDLVTCTGVSSYPYHERQPEFAREVKDANVDIRIDNAENLLKQFPPNTFDVVTAIYIMQYLADPWSVMKKLYTVLKPGGYGLIYPFYSNIEGTERDRLLAYKYLRKQGLVFTNVPQSHRTAVTVTKVEKKLTVPLSYRYMRPISTPPFYNEFVYKPDQRVYNAKTK
jgi:SAM-dependent methyltransferase